MGRSDSVCQNSLGMHFPTTVLARNFMDATRKVSKTPEMEWVDCPLCGSYASDLLYTLQDYYTRKPGLFTFVQCLQCNLVYLNPRPTIDSIATYYPSTYESYISLLPENLPWPTRWLVQYGLWKRCRPLLAKSPGTILDVGCGTGHFLAAMRKYSNWELVGIDRDPQVIAFVREALNIEAYVGRIEESSFPDHAFDAVTMWDSLEHFHYPRRALLKIQHILKPTGVLLLRVPSLDSLDARLFGRFWSGLDAPRHLTVFSQETLCRLLKETGFSVKRLWCMSGSYASFAISLRFSLEYRNLSAVLGRFLQRVIDSPIVSVLSAPYFFILDKLLLGPEITVLAEKARRDW